CWARSELGDERAPRGHPDCESIPPWERPAVSDATVSHIAASCCGGQRVRAFFRTVWLGTWSYRYPELQRHQLAVVCPPRAVHRSVPSSGLHGTWPRGAGGRAGLSSKVWGGSADGVTARAAGPVCVPA